jgi:hypothetical protein
MLQSELHQKGTALEAGAPAGKMERKIEALLLGKMPGEGIIPPRSEVGTGIGEEPAKEAHHRSDGLGQVHTPGLFGCVHLPILQISPGFRPNGVSTPTETEHKGVPWC